jgi:hypothetical protein
MRSLRSAAGFAGGAAALALIAAVLIWRPFLSASTDPGPVDFSTLVRQPAGGDALICIKLLCPRAEADLAPPIFTSSAADVAQELRLYASRSSLIDEIRDGRDPDHLRFVQRSSPFGTPTFIDILVDPRSSGAATVAMYARSAGPPNHGKRLQQLRAWLAAVADDRMD